MGLEVEAVVEATVDPLYRRASVVATPPRRAAPRCRGEDAPVVLERMRRGRLIVRPIRCFRWLFEVAGFHGSEKRNFVPTLQAPVAPIALKCMFLHRMGVLKGKG